MTDCTASHEKLEAVETQLNTLQRSIRSLKADIDNARSKWEKQKAMMESDYASYSEQLDTINKAMTEDDMVSNELDSK